jgi:serine/threonine protein kinase
MGKLCFVSDETKCKHCFTNTCIAQALKNIKILNTIGEGVQGIVLNALWKNKPVAIKIEILNVYPITMTNRSNYKCNNIWSKFLIDLYTEESKRNVPKHAWIRTTKSFEQEAKKSMKLGNANIGPKVYYFKICKNGLITPNGVCDTGILVMEKFDLTLREFIDFIIENDKFRMMRIQEFIHILHDLETLGKRASSVIPFHGDLHNENIVLKFSSNGSLSKVNKIKVRLIDFGLDYNPKRKKYIQDEIKEEIVDSCKYLKKQLYKSGKLTLKMNELLNKEMLYYKN